MSDLNDFINLNPKKLNIPVYAGDSAADTGFGVERKIGSMYYDTSSSGIKIYTGPVSNWSTWAPG